MLFQTPVICKYVGKKFGLWPETEEDEWHADQVNTTIHDFIAEGHLHHLLFKLFNIGHRTILMSHKSTQDLLGMYLTKVGNLFF